MTVSELINFLKTFNPNAVVVYPDEYAREEGYWKGHEKATVSIENVELNQDGKVELF